MWARTFLDMGRLVLTSRSGPAACDIARRIVRHLGIGKIIDDFDPDVEADERVFRRIEPGTHYRVELITKNASKWFQRIGPDVAELDSLPRIVQEAGLREYGGRKLKPGWSLDLTADDSETRQPWDLSDGKVRSKARELIKYGKPYMVICSPMCTSFSQMQNINKNRRDPETIRRELDDAEDHIQFVMSICATQLREHRYFIFEHVDGASSWQMAEVKKLMAAYCVETVNLDMCAFGMTELGEDGV